MLCMTLDKMTNDKTNDLRFMMNYESDYLDWQNTIFLTDI